MPVRFHPILTIVVTAGLITVLAAMPSISDAAEWTAEPALKLRREYNDNLRLSIHPHSSVNGSIITPSLDFGISGQIWEVSGGAEATQRRYSGEGDLDRDDNSLRLSSSYSAERQTFVLNASRTRESVLTDEFTSADTGVVQVQKKRESSNVQPAWTWKVTEKSLLQVAYQLSNVSYENAQNVGLYDYGYRSATATFSSQISELNQFFVVATNSVFHVSATGFVSNSRNFQAGITRTFSENTRGTLQAGQRRTESLIQGGKPVYTRFSTTDGDFLVQTGVTQDARNRTTGSVFGGNLESKFENTRLKASFSRALDPSGSGGEVEQDALSLQFFEQWTARTTLSVIANANKSRYLDGNISNSERTFYDVGPGVYWQWTREWSVGANYRYAHVKRVYEDRAASSRTAYLALVYRPLKMSISR